MLFPGSCQMAPHSQTPTGVPPITTLLEILPCITFLTILTRSCLLEKPVLTVIIHFSFLFPQYPLHFFNYPIALLHLSSLHKTQRLAFRDGLQLWKEGARTYFNTLFTFLFRKTGGGGGEVKLDNPQLHTFPLKQWFFPVLPPQQNV